MVSEERNTTKIAVLDTRMKNFEDRLDDINVNMQDGFDKIDKQIETLKECFVQKPVYKSDKELTDNRLKLLERINFGLISIIVATVIYSVIYLVIK